MPVEWDWLDFSTLNQKSDDNQSDIEVISNPSITDSEPLVMATEPPRLLYSEVLLKPAVPESDIECVPEPATPDLEFDDEEYLREVLRSTRLSSEEELTECSEDEETAHELDSKEVVLEVNLTLLSFTIIVGVSGLSGFLLGGIYSGVLTNNIQHVTDLAEYPGVLPSFLYTDSGCESRLYRMEENMKQLKDTLSHDIRDCHYKLKTAVRQSAAFHKTNTETAEYDRKKCVASRADIAELQGKSSALLGELENQKERLRRYKDQASSEAARNVLQIASLAQTLHNTKGDLEKARRAVSVLDGLNTECRKNSILSSYTSSKAVGAAKQQSDESNFWKNLYKHAIMDLEQADQKVADLEKNLKGELENLRESQVAESNAKINYLKERNSKHYFKVVADKYEDLQEMFLRARSREQQLGQEFETLKTLTMEMEYNLETCSNATVRAEQKTKSAIKSKQYVEAILINRISNDKEEYKALKEMYRNQEGIIAEMEAQRASLEESLIRKIASNRKKFLSAKSNLEKTLTAFGTSKQATSAKYNILKSKVGKSREEKKVVREELEQSKALITEYQEQMGIFESYIKQIESQLLKLREDIIMREAIQREYILSKERQHEGDISAMHAHYNSDNAELQTKLSETKLALDSTSDTLSSRSAAFDKLKRKHDTTIEKLEEVESSKKYWRDAAKFQKHQAETLSRDLENCKAGKFTAISEYKKTTELLLELIQDVASKPKGELPAIYYVTSPYMTSPPFPLSILPEDLCSSVAEDEVLLNNSTKEKWTSPACVLNSLLSDTCYNVTRSRATGRKMSTALSKYWGGAVKYPKYWGGAVKYPKYWGGAMKYPKGPSSVGEGKAWYSRLGKEDSDTAYTDSDWYMARKGEGKEDSDWYMARKGEGKYSYVNKKKTKKDNKRQKGGFDCQYFDCFHSSHFGFELCGC